MIYFILWIALALLVSTVSKNRKLGQWPGFFLSLLLSPLIGLIIALVSPRIDGMEKQFPKYTPYEVEQIKKLYKLRDSGAITEEEFRLKKAKMVR